MAWQFEYYNIALHDEIERMPKQCLAKFLAILLRLRQFGPDVQRMPHIRHLQNGLWEIRAIAGDGSMRVFYCWRDEQCLVLLHTFKKKSQETPKHELDKALRRMKEVKDAH